MDINTITVIGAGLMGRGIAQVSAQAGYTTHFCDIDKAQLDKGMATIKKLLEKNVAKERITKEEMETILGRIIPSTSLDALDKSQLVIEAVSENTELKKKIFKDLDGKCPPDTILATNTSSIPITEIAAVTSRPEKVIGMHFMNPVPVMKLVEIVMGYCTSEETLSIIRDLSAKMKKIVVVAKRDFAGFIVNRITLPIVNEAAWLIHDDMGTVEDVDAGIKLGLNHPMGPLQLIDFVGIDTCVNVLEVMYKYYGDPKYRPCPILKQMVQAGHIGVKSGKGFYDYTKPAEGKKATA